MADNINTYADKAVKISLKVEKYLEDIAKLTDQDVKRYPLYLLQGKMLTGEIDLLQKGLDDEEKMADIQLSNALTIHREQLQGILDALELAEETKTRISQQKINTMMKLIKEKFGAEEAK